MATQRTHRTLEEWRAVLAERAKEPAIPVKGHTGSVRVNVFGQPWQAPRVAELRAMGFEVIIRHAYRYRPNPLRNMIKWTEMPKIKVPRGGRCFVTLLHKDGYWARGMVQCHSGDTYSKRIGYVLAVNRALDQLDGQ